MVVAKFNNVKMVRTETAGGEMSERTTTVTGLINKNI